MTKLLQNADKTRTLSLRFIDHLVSDILQCRLITKMTRIIITCSPRQSEKEAIRTNNDDDLNDIKKKKHLMAKPRNSAADRSKIKHGQRGAVNKQQQSKIPRGASFSSPRLQRETSGGGTWTLLSDL